jgi:hypothetical protein
MKVTNAMPISPFCLAEMPYAQAAAGIHNGSARLSTDPAPLTTSHVQWCRQQSGRMFMHRSRRAWVRASAAIRSLVLTPNETIRA